MAIEVTLPDLGDGIESGDVLTVHVSEGDTVRKDQPLLELETDKASVDIPSTAAGKVTKVHVSAGDSVSIGSVLVTLEATEAESKSAEPPKQDPQEDKEPEPADQPAEEPVAESEEESSEPTEEAQEEPATKEKPAAAPSKPAPSKSASSKPAKADEPVQVKSPTPPPVPAGELIHEDADSVPAGPAVRRFAREVGVDLRMVRGSGPGGRVTRDDVLLTVRQLSQGTGSAASTLAAPTPEATPNSTSAPPPIVPSGESGQDKYGPIKAEKMRKIRKVTAAQMTASWTTVPRVTNFDDADVTALEELRQQSKADYAEAGVKLTSMPFLIKAVALALKAHPEVNATVDLENEQIIYKEYVNVGIAVDSERGLVVPNIRNTDRMSIPDIARTLQQTAADIRGNNFSPSQLQGGTFTISNLGAIGGTYSTPIINIPEVAILLVGRSRMMPVVVDGQIVPRLMMPMSLSYDHRLVDGASAARFLNEVISYLEAPSRLLMAP